jgi:hypothetical protein
MKIIMSFAAVLFGFPVVVPANAGEKIYLPDAAIGNWAHIWKGQHDCTRLRLTIERDHVIERYDEGVGRCAIKRIKRRGKVIFGAYECKWDESVPEGMREPPDEDGTGFSILIKSPDYILYNNTPMARCSSFGVLK